MTMLTRPRITAVLAVAAVVTVGLAAPTWASRSGTKLGTSQIKKHAITTSRLAPNAVISSRVRDGSLTASDIAPNTFLPTDGTAADSDKLNGQPASAYATGPGGLVSGSVSTIPNGTDRILSLGFGQISGSCGKLNSAPTFVFVAQQAPLNVVVTTTTNTSGGATTTVATANGLAAGDSLPGTNSTGNPQTATFQVRYVDGNNNTHIATAWVSGEDIVGKCLFFGQGMTSG